VDKVFNIAYFSGDYSRLDWVPDMSPKYESLGIAEIFYKPNTLPVT